MHNCRYSQIPHILHPLSLPMSSIQYLHPSSPFPPHPLSTAAQPPHPSVDSPWPSASSPHPPAPSVSSCSSPAPPACSSPLSICWPNLLGRGGGKDVPDQCIKESTFLHTLPVSSLGLCIDDHTARIAIGPPPSWYSILLTSHLPWTES